MPINDFFDFENTLLILKIVFSFLKLILKIVENALSPLYMTPLKSATVVSSQTHLSKFKRKRLLLLE